MLEKARHAARTAGPENTPEYEALFELPAPDCDSDK
jgi:hypothetical protein